MSIRKRLTLLILSMVILTCFLAFTKGYRESMNQAEALLDNELVTLAHVLIEQPLSKETPAYTSDLPQLLFQVWVDGSLASSSKSLQHYPINKSQWQTGFSVENLAGQRVKVFRLSEGNKRVLIAEPLSKRVALTETVILSAMTPLLWSVPILAVLISVFVKQGLAPLTRLSNQLKHRQANDFTAIPWQTPEQEIKPVISRLNDLFKRVESAYLRERFFASDAAHELRTPLSSLKINVHNLLAQGVDSVELNAMEKGVDKLSNIVEQMLILGRTYPEQWQAQFSPVSVLEISQHVVAQLYDRIDEKEHSISIDGDDFVIAGDEFTLVTLFGNLLSNAIKYTPAVGEIGITLKTENNRFIWQIDDSGPGIDEAQKQRIFNRFYRVGGDKHPSGEQGAGLGMAIVEHIVSIYNADITLADSHLGGLRVIVSFMQGEVSE
ncbi:ATP-binding protein [Pseudoalteromonas arabiensis]|uniref:ATP-binding protein n=1 Tax=Pseudoalteromonas arabiensis TaxID=874454 RepID=UPI000782B972|nr:ATP-binding protein [Pseudoalteromonas arabiensis]